MVFAIDSLMPTIRKSNEFFANNSSGSETWRNRVSTIPSRKETMTDDEVVVRVLDVLNELGIQYMLVGSLSSNYYSIARSTADAVFVLELKGTRISEVAGKLGNEFKLEPPILFESITGTTRHVIAVLTVPFRVDCFRLSSDEHDQERFRRRRNVRFNRFDRDVTIPTAEDVIITKHRWAVAGDRGKDADDVANVIAVQGDAIDWVYVNGWCDRHDTRERLDSIRASIPPLD